MEFRGLGAITRWRCVWGHCAGTQNDPPLPDGLRQGRQSRRPFAKALQKRPMRMHSSGHPSNTNEREEHAKNARKK